MVTIANYLNGNFATKQANELERPICILVGKEEDIRVLWSYSTKKNIQNKRNILIVDFGIAWMNTLAATSTEFIKDKRKFAKINEAHNQHVLLPGRSPQSLTICLTLLQEYTKTHNLPDMLLFIQGLLAVQLFQKESQIEKFIGLLSSISPAYKQINILANEGLNKKTKYNLERLSTCIINVNKNLEKEGGAKNPYEGKWEASMVVRRYTGFSHQEDYQIQVKEDKLKVDRLKREVPTEAEESHIQGMGFTVKKTTKKQDLEQIKNIIYPYLSKQTCGKCQNANCQCKQPDIVLDDEQQQDDDVDV